MPRRRSLPVRSDQPSDIQVAPAGMSLDELNKKLILQALERSNGNRTKVAKLLGMSRPIMIYRIEKYNITIPSKG
jgi:transcriptional regulator with PAS, ATPase and Fis domain